MAGPQCRGRIMLELALPFPPDRNKHGMAGLQGYGKYMQKYSFAIPTG